LLGSSADKADADLIRKKAPDTTDLAGKTDLRQVATVLGMSSLLISADSGLLHIAYAVDTPTVSLFGSGIEKKWAPRGKKHLVINKYLDCSPCTRFGYTPTCKRNVECLASIRVGEVIEAARTILDAS
jgi:ADP-heptose:LPS heptosyltransferase